MSLPAWGAWVEIAHDYLLESKIRSLPAWGAWVEIARAPSTCAPSESRSPHGERGLKSSTAFDDVVLFESLPAWGAWVEMFEGFKGGKLFIVAPRMGSVG